MIDSRHRTIATWVWHQEALEALRLAADTLDGARVPFLVVKGMVLAYTLHDDVADRPMRDVDLRVPPGDFVRAVRSMRARGFPTYWTSRQLGAVAFRVRDVLVEIEASVGPPGLCGLGVAEMMSRARWRDLPNGVRVREPDLHDHAILLVANAFKDKFFGTAPWSLDDLELIAKRIDPATFLERVRAARARTMTWIVADWMAQERASESWRTIRAQLGERPPRASYTRALLWLIRRHPTSIATPALARIASDSVLLRGWALTAAGLGLGVQAIGRHL